MNRMPGFARLITSCCAHTLLMACVADMSLSDYLSSDSLWAQITG